MLRKSIFTQEQMGLVGRHRHHDTVHTFAPTEGLSETDMTDSSFMEDSQDVEEIGPDHIEGFINDKSAKSSQISEDFHGKAPKIEKSPVIPMSLNL